MQNASDQKDLWKKDYRDLRRIILDRKLDLSVRMKLLEYFTEFMASLKLVTGKKNGNDDEDNNDEEDIEDEDVDAAVEDDDSRHVMSHPNKILLFFASISRGPLHWFKDLFSEYGLFDRELFGVVILPGLRRKVYEVLLSFICFLDSIRDTSGSGHNYHELTKHRIGRLRNNAKKEISVVIDGAMQIVKEIVGNGSVENGIKKKVEDIAELRKVTRRGVLEVLAERRIRGADDDLLEDDTFKDALLGISALVMKIETHKEFDQGYLVRAVWKTMIQKIVDIYAARDEKVSHVQGWKKKLLKMIRPRSLDETGKRSVRTKSVIEELNGWVLSMGPEDVDKIIGGAHGASRDSARPEGAIGNKGVIKGLVAKGYKKELWDDGVELEVPLSLRLTEEEKKEQILSATFEMVEIAIIEGLTKLGDIKITQDYSKTIDDSKKAEKFLEETIKVIKKMPEDSKLRLKAIVKKVKRFERSANGADNINTFRVTIKKDFFREALAGRNVPGCFDEGGIARQMPFIHGAEANAGFIQVYNTGGVQEANAVIVYGPEGAYVYPLYNSTGYNMSAVFGEALIELSRYVPKIYLKNDSAGYEYVSKYCYEASNITINKQSVIFSSQYYDSGSVDHNGMLTLAGDFKCLEYEKIKRAGGFRKRQIKGRKTIMSGGNPFFTHEDRRRFVGRISSLRALKNINVGTVFSNLEEIMLKRSDKEIEELVSSLKTYPGKKKKKGFLEKLRKKKKKKFVARPISEVEKAVLFKAIKKEKQKFEFETEIPESYDRAMLTELDIYSASELPLSETEKRDKLDLEAANVVIRMNGKIAGFITATTDDIDYDDDKGLLGGHLKQHDRVLYIDDIYIHPHFRKGSQVVRRLLGEFRKEAKRKGFNKIVSHSRIKNGLSSFLQSVGAKKIATKEDWLNNEDFDLIVLDLDNIKHRKRKKPLDFEMPGIMRDITDPDEACFCLFEMLMSLKFSKNIKLIFDEDIAQDQPGSPLGKLKDAVNAFKRNEGYSKMMGELDLITVSSGEIKKNVIEARDAGDEVLVFSTAVRREGLSDIENMKKVHATYIDENDFPGGAYYPLLEVLVISLARTIDPDIMPEGLNKVLETLNIELELNEVNIDSILREGKTLLFTLLPDAIQYNKNELIKMYALLGRFLVSA